MYACVVGATKSTLYIEVYHNLLISRSLSNTSKYKFQIASTLIL